MGTVRFVVLLIVTNCAFPDDYDLESISRDLESFAKHAGRTQISTDDVMLLARRNEGLEALLRSYVEKIRKEKDGGGRGGRR
jgi:centromere protein S